MDRGIETSRIGYALSETCPSLSHRGEADETVSSECTAKKLPRKIFVQPNTRVNGQGEVELVEYPVTVEGVIESFVERGL